MPVVQEKKADKPAKKANKQKSDIVEESVSLGQVKVSDESKSIFEAKEKQM